jgi:hypothetical protein
VDPGDLVVAVVAVAAVSASNVADGSRPSARNRIGVGCTSLTSSRYPESSALRLVCTGSLASSTTATWWRLTNVMLSMPPCAASPCHTDVQVTVVCRRIGLHEFLQPAVASVGRPGLGRRVRVARLREDEPLKPVAGANTPFSGRLNGVALAVFASALALNALVPSESVSWIVTQCVLNTSPGVCRSSVSSLRMSASAWPAWNAIGWPLRFEITCNA